MRDPGRTDTTGSQGGSDPARSDRVVAISRLKRRADFLRAAKGHRWHGKGFTLQGGTAAGAPTAGLSDGSARIGFTVTKKVGNAVVRNRARRRLREALRLATGLPVEPGCDYVIVARLEAIRLPFETLQADIGRAVRSLRGKTRSQGAPGERPVPKPQRLRQTSRRESERGPRA